MQTNMLSDKTVSHYLEGEECDSEGKNENYIQ
jgi:hypothetical protein